MHACMQARGRHQMLLYHFPPFKQSLLTVSGSRLVASKLQGAFCLHPLPTVLRLQGHVFTGGLGSKLRPPSPHSKHSPTEPSLQLPFIYSLMNGNHIYHLLQLSLPNPQCLPSTQDVVISSNLSRRHENGLKTIFFLRLGSQMYLFTNVTFI